MQVGIQECHAGFKHSWNGSNNVFAVAIFHSSHVVAKERHRLDDEGWLKHLRVFPEEKQPGKGHSSVGGHDLQVLEQLLFGHTEFVEAFAIVLFEIVVDKHHVDVVDGGSSDPFFVWSEAARFLE